MSNQFASPILCPLAQVKPAHRPCGKSKNRGKYKVQILESVVLEQVEPERGSFRFLHHVDDYPAPLRDARPLHPQTTCTLFDGLLSPPVSLFSPEHAGEFNQLSSAPVAAPQQPDVPRKLPANGKTWKPLEAKRASAIHKSKKSVSWDKKMQLRQAAKEAKEQQRLVEEMQKEERREEHRRRLQRQKQKEENEKKSSSFQVIKDASKIKKMSKKQLRYIQKADVLQ